MSQFPLHRSRRLRRSEAIRGLVRETEVSASDLILPLFAVPGEGVRRPVGSMPGVTSTSPDQLLRDAETAFALGIRAVLLFGVPEHKDEQGSGGYDANGAVQQSVRLLKRELPELLVATDVCLCAYTTHGHCGLLRRDGSVDNDASLPLLARMATSHAEAGADVVAPSDMMDGRVGAIRRALDGGGYPELPVLAYAAKYASGFYGPFREAADSAPQFGDRRGYQMDPANVAEALREARLDIEEGADMIMVKPALAYLDVIARVKRETGFPLCAYHVSGEYAAVLAAAERGWLDGDRALDEALLAMKRAGADMIITYHARRFAERRRAAS